MNKLYFCINSLIFILSTSIVLSEITNANDQTEDNNTTKNEKDFPSQGKFIMTNGLYHGQSKDGKPHGQGAYYYDDGDVLIGGWVNGKSHGLLTELTASENHMVVKLMRKSENNKNMKKGDKIVSVDNERFRTAQEFTNYIKASPDKILKVKAIREGKLIEYSVTVGSKDNKGFLGVGLHRSNLVPTKFEFHKEGFRHGMFCMRGDGGRGKVACGPFLKGQYVETYEDFIKNMDSLLKESWGLNRLGDIDKLLNIDAAQCKVKNGDNWDDRSVSDRGYTLGGRGTDYYGDCASTNTSDNFGKTVMVAHGGQGIMIIKGSGKIYIAIGEFMNNKLNGEGTLVIANYNNDLDIIKSIGTFVDNELNGEGLVVSTNGGKIFGEFENGELTGEGTTISDVGVTQSGFFCRGEFGDPNGNCGLD